MLLISSSAVFAQIELVKTLSLSNEGRYYFAGNMYAETDWSGDINKIYLSGVEGFITWSVNKESNSFSMNILSSDFSVSTKNIQVSSFNGYEISYIEPSQHIFNNDDELEFMVEYRLKDYNSSSSLPRVILILYDSKGNIIKDFGGADYAYWEAGLCVMNNQSYIVISKEYESHNSYSYDWTYTLEIYSVPTTVNPNQLKSATVSNTTLSAFPNPAKTYVNLSYNVSGVEDAVMTITDASGRVVEQKTVNAMSDKLRLNVANYKRGLYFYEVQGFSGRFIVE